MIGCYVAWYLYIYLIFLILQRAGQYNKNYNFRIFIHRIAISFYVVISDSVYTGSITATQCATNLYLLPRSAVTRHYTPLSPLPSPLPPPALLHCTPQSVVTDVLLSNYCTEFRFVIILSYWLRLAKLSSFLTVNIII